MANRSYLANLARLFYERKGKSLYQYRFFFQSKRAGSFFKFYLENESDKSRGALILPETTTLYNFLERSLNMPEADPNRDLLLIYHLYCCFRREYPCSVLDFEGFYDIGKQLLADFNDIDTHLEDAGTIFTNMDYLGKATVDPRTYLSEEQIDALQKFVKVDLKESFDKGYAEFWLKMPRIYNSFKELLRSIGLAYNGMLLRDVLEHLEKGELDILNDGKINVFIGFNALSLSERKLLKFFKDNGEALFYWDYDNDLLKKSFTEKARLENECFPEPTGELAYERELNDCHRPKLEIISIPSKVAQSVYIGSEIIPKLQIDFNNPNTAIILPDESQLVSLLNHIDLPVDMINVTMGFPIKELPIIGKLLHIINFQSKVNNRKGVWRSDELKEICSFNFVSTDFSLGELLNKSEGKQLFYTNKALRDYIGHQYTDIQEVLYLNENLNPIQNSIQLIKSVLDRDEIEASEHSALIMIESLLTAQSDSFQNLVTEYGEVNQLISKKILFDLVYTTISRARIPFEGEPLKGLQIMGVLEARSIDFDTVIVMDAGEGLLPKSTRKYGLIPQGLRYGYGLPTYQWQDDIRAYNFFRLLSRSENIYTLYDSRKGTKSSGEPSRYLRLLTEIYQTDAIFRDASFDLIPIDHSVEDFSIDLNGVLAEYRSSVTKKGSNKELSPSRILQYMVCPRQFYYQTVLGLSEEDEFEELLDNKEEGTIIHGALDTLYKEFKGKLVEDHDLNKITNGDIEEAVYRVYCRLYPNDINEGAGYNQVLLNLITKIVTRVIQKDLNDNVPFFYVGGEVPLHVTYTYDASTGSTVNLKGFIDRVDIKDGCLRLFDYKTGSDDFLISIEDSFNRDSTKISRAAIQLFTYASMVLNSSEEWAKNFTEDTLEVLLFKVRSREHDIFVNRYEKETKNIARYSVIKNLFEKELCGVLKAIVETDMSFAPNPKKGGCNYCAARKLCSSAEIIDF